MQLMENLTVREIAANSLAAVRIFEKLGIDYCCGGNRALTEVCREKGLDHESIQHELDVASRNTARDERLKSAPDRLIHHIVTVHHIPAAGVARVDGTPRKVYRVYNQRYGPTLTASGGVCESESRVGNAPLKEKRSCSHPSLPMRRGAGRPATAAPFGTVARPIHMMELEHESAGQAPPRSARLLASTKYRIRLRHVFFDEGLDELEHDLHAHSPENNICFASAEIEARAGDSGWSYPNDFLRATQASDGIN
jgi:regulator of cell morphogenesis and NO signaling